MHGGFTVAIYRQAINANIVKIYRKRYNNTKNFKKLNKNYKKIKRN